MSLIIQIGALLRKDLKIELRQKSAINGILLYVVSTVFVCYLAFQMETNAVGNVVWNTVFWIILLFISLNTAAKSFSQEKEERMVYYYSIASPQAIILAKIAYNTFLMLIVYSLAFLSYSLIMGNPVLNTWLFFLNGLVGAIGFSSILTMVAGIASKADNNTTLMAILSFPLMIPMLLMLIRVSKNAMDGIELSASYDELWVLGGMNLAVVMLSFILFPYVWKS